MVGERTDTLCRIAQIHRHQDLFVLRKTQIRCQLIRIEIVDPAAVHALIGRRQDHVRRHDRRVFNTGISLASGIGKYIVFVESNKEHCGSTVTAGSHGIELCERLCRLEHIDMLLLQVLCSGCQPSRRQDGIQLFGLHLAVTIFFAGITGFDHFFEFHIHTSRFSRQKLPFIVAKIRVPAFMV